MNKVYLLITVEVNPDYSNETMTNGVYASKAMAEEILAQFPVDDKHIVEKYIHELEAQ